MPVRPVPASALAAALLAVTAGGAAAATEAAWCSDSGDTCASIVVRGDRVVARTAYAARYVRSTRICVATPRVARVCRTRVVRPDRGVWVARLVLVRRAGVYRMFAAPDVTLTIRVPPARTRCAPVPVGSGPASTATAVNMACRPARALVRATALGRGVAPGGWVFVNPAGCEGLIVRAADAAWVRAHGYRPRPDRPAVVATVYPGCRS